MRNIQLIELGTIEYGEAWDFQESLLRKGLDAKIAFQDSRQLKHIKIQNYLLLCRHPHVYTLGNSGDINHLLVNEKQLQQLGISFYKSNRGGDITYHGPGQLVAYPILDLEQFFTDIRKYVFNLEETIIQLLKVYGIEAGRLKGSTGVWLDTEMQGKQRKICAIGIRCSKWITLHGLALNINTNLSYFNQIVPCGISDKGVTSMQNELGSPVDEKEVERIFVEKFAEVFESEISSVKEASKIVS